MPTPESIQHWSTRASLFGSDGVLNIGHSADRRAAFDQAERAWLLPLLDELLACEPALSIGTALDFGCGSGRFSNDLAARFNTVIAFDPSQGWAETWTPAQNVLRVLGSLETLQPHLDALESPHTLDFIWTSTVLQHIPDEELVGIADFLSRVANADTRLFLVEHITQQPFREESQTVAGVRSFCWHRTLEFYQDIFPAFALEEVSVFEFDMPRLAVLTGKRF